MASVYTEISVVTVGRDGTQISTVEEAGVIAGNRFKNDGRTLLLVINDGAGACNITPVLPDTIYGDTVTFVNDDGGGTLSVPTLEHRIFGPFPVERFNHRTGG